MTRLRATATVALLLLLSACSKVTPENYARLESGMTREQVYAVLGKPDEVSGSGVGKLTMSSELWEGKAHRVTVTFAGDRIVLKNIQAADSR